MIDPYAIGQRIAKEMVNYMYAENELSLYVLMTCEKPETGMDFSAATETG